MTIGTVSIALVMFSMRLISLPGTLIWHAGRRSGESPVLGGAGLLVYSFAAAFVAGAYIVFVIGVLRHIAQDNPSMPTWPLWIGVWFHALAPAAFIAGADYPRSERPDTPPSGLLQLITLGIFFTALLSPVSLQPLYHWVPLSDYASGADTAPEASKNQAQVVFGPAHTEAVQSFFFAYQLTQSVGPEAAKLVRAVTDFQQYVESVKAPLKQARAYLEQCDPQLLNDVYAGWGDITEEKFQPGVEHLLRGISSEVDRQALAEGDELLSEFSDWLEANWNRLGRRLEQVDFAEPHAPD
ncbi:hypothetical protein [Thioalkalivibrio sp. XN8]|uniref:hypothetical protein n=1 Tax=Thioalkalivibrio sp. XN8 TaxID=2712863 RepID=UPI0013EDA320|nr:hypothetical protein [Thioalkalivibrio sp. XN8]NGP53576.1 hypothetical protein [Thioalkalivibrio sp. XN8]